MRNYEVDIPLDHTLRFKQSVKTLEERITRVPATEGVDPEILWRQQLSHARTLVQQLIEQQDPEDRERIHQGLQRMIEDEHRRYYPLHRVRADIDYDQVAALLSSFLTDNLPQGDNIPDNVRPIAAEERIHFGFINSPSHRSPILPQDIFLLFDVYGFVDGKQKSHGEVGEKYHLSKNVVTTRVLPLRRQIFQRALWDHVFERR